MTRSTRATITLAVAAPLATGPAVWLTVVKAERPAPAADHCRAGGVLSMERRRGLSGRDAHLRPRPGRRGAPVRRRSTVARARAMPAPLADRRMVAVPRSALRRRGLAGANRATGVSRIERAGFLRAHSAGRHAHRHRDRLAAEHSPDSPQPSPAGPADRGCRAHRAPGRAPSRDDRHQGRVRAPRSGVQSHGEAAWRNSSSCSARWRESTG